MLRKGLEKRLQTLQKEKEDKKSGGKVCSRQVSRRGLVFYTVGVFFHVIWMLD